MQSNKEHHRGGMTARILHIGKFFPPDLGGMETFLADLVAEQRRQGIDARALVHGQPRADDPPWLTRVPVQLELVYAPIALGFRRRLRNLLTEFQPDLLHLHLPNNAAFWCLTLGRALRTPWVLHWHSDVMVNPRRLALRLAYLAYQPFERALLRRAASVIATSPPYLQASRPLAPWRQQCEVIPLGLSATTAEPLSNDSTMPSLWRPGVLRLLSIGRLTHYKGFETLIRALAATPGVELLIAGDGELRPTLATLIEHSTPAGQLPSVRLLGRCDETTKQQLLADCELFCLPSCERTEAFGLVILEAMRQGVPCLVSDLAGSGLPWIVRSSGAGWCVPPHDVAAWQAAIVHAQQSPAEREHAGASGRQAFAQRFTIEVCCRQLLPIYQCQLDAPVLPTTPRGLLIVIPARDEAQTLPTLLQALQQSGFHDVVVIDDHSQDGTGAVAALHGATVLRPALPLGAWGGMQAGIRLGLARAHEAVITMDADGQHEVSEIAALLAQREEADLVIGAFPERGSPLRQLAWTWFRRLTGFELQDLTSGFRLYNQAAMQVAASPEATLLDYQDVGALLLIRKAGLRIIEVPVSMNLRQVGASRIFNSWFSVLKYMAITTLLCLARREPRRHVTERP